MRLVRMNRKAVREALADEGWRFTLTDSQAEFKQHHAECRGLTLPVASESTNRSRTIREQLVGQLPWDMRGQPFPRWMSYISREARKRVQPNLPLAAQFCLTHGFTFLVGDVWAERQQNGWRIHRADGPAVICKDGTFYFWRGWRVSPRTVMKPPTTERILAETNQTEREVLLQRMGMENFAREANLEPVDSFSGSALLKVNTAETRSRWHHDRGSVEERVPLAFLKVICPSTQKTYFLRVDPETETTKQALESTLPGYRRDWHKDLVAES